jgi:hypothetical protein
MPERLAIAPPAPEQQPPQHEDDGDVLVGNIVGPEHPGLNDSFDATPESEDGAKNIVTEDPQVEKPEVFSVVDAGVDENGKRQAYERTYVRDADGQYQENVGARRKTTVLSPDEQGGWTTDNPYNNGGEQQKSSHGSRQGTDNDRHSYEYTPPPFRDREEPLHDYERRVWEDLKNASYTTHKNETLRERIEREHAEWTEQYHDYFDNAGEQELKRREAAAEAAGELLRDLIGLGKQERLGVFDPTHEFLGEERRKDIEESISKIQEGLRSADPNKRAEATNALLDVIDALHEIKHDKEYSADDKLNRRVFSPREMRTFLHVMREGLNKERNSLEKEPSDENLTDEERYIAMIIMEYGMSANYRADSEGMLIDGAAVFGSAAEKAFKESQVSTVDYRLNRFSKEELGALIGRAFQKLRQRAIEQLDREEEQTLSEPIKNAIKTQQQTGRGQSEFDLAA